MTAIPSLKPGERLDELIKDRLVIIQHPGKFRFSMDAVLLSSFATVRPGSRVCDLGTGTGVIPLLMSAKTDASHLAGLEIQPDMVDMARRSVSINGLSDRIDIRLGDLREAQALLGRDRFDSVVCNPPFTTVGTGLVNPEDALAIARHEICCTLEDVVLSAASIAVPKGRVAIVHRPSRLVDIMCLMRNAGLEPKRLRFVYPRGGKPPNLLLVEAIKGGGKELEVMEPLVIYRDDGSYTDEVKRIYVGDFKG